VEKIPDTSSGISPPTGYPHVVAGVHIGRMALSLPRVFSSVLTVAEQPGTVPDGVAHRHLHLSHYDIDLKDLDEAAGWVLGQLDAQRPVLIRSEGGKQRPALVAGFVILYLGGYYTDAMYCLRKADPGALTDFRYLHLLQKADQVINSRLRKRAQ
jgi:hypothetical protein